MSEPHVDHYCTSSSLKVVNSDEGCSLYRLRPSDESWWNLLRSDQVHSQMSESNRQRVKAQLSDAGSKSFSASETPRLQDLFAEFSSARRKGAGPEARLTFTDHMPSLQKSCRLRAINKTIALRCRGLRKHNPVYYAMQDDSSDDS